MAAATRAAAADTASGDRPSSRAGARPRRRPTIAPLSPRASARATNECRRSCRRTPTSPARARTLSQCSLRLARRPPRLAPTSTQGFAGNRRSSASTEAVAGASGTTRAAVPPLRSRSTPARRLTSTHLRVRTSFRRQPVSISSRSAAAAERRAQPPRFAAASVSISSRTLPSRRYSSRVRLRSRRRSRYLRIGRTGCVPSSRRPHVSARANIVLRMCTTWFARYGMSRRRSCSAVTCSTPTSITGMPPSDGRIHLSRALR